MAIYRLYPTKDVSIANEDPAFPFLSITSSNVGAAEILNLYYTSVATSSSAHVLVQFDLTQIPAAASGSGTAYRFHLADAQHSETLPTEFTALIYETSQSWNEGKGLDLDFYTDLGAANWISASLSAAWATPGGAFSGLLSSSYYFDTGHEDLDADVTAIVRDWLSGTANNGFFVEINPALTDADYYIKKFHSRQTHFPAKRPYLEARWSDWTGSLSTTTYWQASSGAWSGSFLDPRLSGTVPGALVSVTNSLVDPTGAIVLSLYDLHPAYDTSEVATLHVAARPKDYSPAAVASASAASSGTVLTNAFYRVVDAVTEDILIPFGSGAVPYTKLSYNDLGNYFSFYMSALPTGNLLRFDFAYQVGSGTVFVRGDDFTFRVR